VPNERWLTKKVSGFLNKQIDQGARMWFLKTQSQGIQRAGVPDFLLCIHGLFYAIELKSPEKKAEATPRQRYELGKLEWAGAEWLVSNTYEVVKMWVLDRLSREYVRWTYISDVPKIDVRTSDPRDDGIAGNVRIKNVGGYNPTD